MITLLYIDGRQTDDGIFIARLGRELARAAKAGRRFVMVHGVGETTVRAIEGAGGVVSWQGDVLHTQPELMRRYLDQTVRESNRRMVAALGEVLVYAVGLQGYDRGLLRESEGGLTVNPAIVTQVLGLGAVPVVSALFRSGGDGAVRQASAATVVNLLGKALQPEPIQTVVLTRDERVGVFRDGAMQETLGLECISETDRIPSGAVLSELGVGGSAVVVTGVAALGLPNGIRGTRLLVTSSSQKMPL